MSKAVTSGVINHVSPSQITTFTRCEAKWAFEKVLGLRPPSTKSQATGTEVHAHIEKHHEDGTVPPETKTGNIARVMLELLPHRSPENLIEHPLDAPEIRLSDVRTLGFIDFAVPPTNEKFRIYDSKTTKDLKWAKRESELRENVQLLIYAHWGFQKWPQATNADLSHVYGVTEGPPTAKAVTTTVDRDHVATYIDRYNATVGRMISAAKHTDPERWSRNYDACNDFGGCAFKDRCLKSPEARLSVLFNKEDNVGLRDKLSKTPIPTGILPPDVPKPLSATPPPTPAVASATPAPPQGQPTVSAPPGADGLFLYVDCLPTKGVVVDVRLEEDIHSRVELILKEHGAQSIDLAPLDYGKGRALLAASFRTNPPRGVVLATSGGLSTVVLEVLAPLAEVVVRGTR